MKKTLFAVAALATMLPAMAENWNMWDIELSPYGNDTNPDHYSFYLYYQDATDITSVKTTLESLSLTDFTATAGTAYSVGVYNDNLSLFSQYGYENKESELSTALDGNKIWGVGVYQHQDVAMFSLIQPDPAGIEAISVLAYYPTETGQTDYTSFKPESPATPEPATATLSLLALAGLATRRKRK